eukprot:4528019-Heterocapsa_arctica.AAC.1
MDARRIPAEVAMGVNQPPGVSCGCATCDLSMAGTRKACKSLLANGHPAGIPWIGLTPVPRAPAHLTLLVP